MTQCSQVYVRHLSVLLVKAKTTPTVKFKRTVRFFYKAEIAYYSKSWTPSALRAAPNLHKTY